MTHISIIGAALIVAAAILSAAHTIQPLKPLTPTDRCLDLSATWDRQQKVGDPHFAGADVQSIYAACIAAELRERR